MSKHGGQALHSASEGTHYAPTRRRGASSYAATHQVWVSPTGFASKLARFTATTLNTGSAITGETKQALWQENKQCRQHKQLQQQDTTYWTEYKGKWAAPAVTSPPTTLQNSMCLRGLALHHPAAGHLLSYAMGRCPTNTGHNWTTQEIEAAIARGPHISAMNPAAMAQLAT